MAPVAQHAQALELAACSAIQWPAYSRHRARNSALETSSLRRPLARNSSSIFHSIGRPWQSQPGT